MQHIHIKITGRVQGVFFRENTRKEAESIGVTGYVRNMDDGSVEVEAEGTEEQIKKLIAFCKTGKGSAIVENITVTGKEPTNEFSAFEIRY